jgi:predicted MPP superfamily phosphohydrolase
MSTFLLVRTAVSLAFISLFAAVSARALKHAFPLAWQVWVRRALHGAWAAGAAGVVLWFIGRATGVGWLATVGIVPSTAVMVTTFILAFTLPIWFAPTAVAGVLARVRRGPDADQSSPSVDEGRRSFLRKAAGALPVSAAVAGPTGTAASMLAPVVREVQIPVDDLDPALDGLKILQLTDVHLGTFIDTDQVERAVEAARPHAPDLVVLTGDVADDYSKLPAALEHVASLEAPLGAFAIYGNHEVYRGRAEAARIYGESEVRLLCEEGVVLEHGAGRLWLCGADDPATLGREHRPFLVETVKRSLAACPDDVACRVLLSHRPEGFEEAARQGATLTLSGHTHGAQVAILGRSFFGWMLPNNYLLGLYEKAGSHLYTSAGLGHWFPFRLNCPCEAALIVLRRREPRAEKSPSA